MKIVTIGHASWDITLPIEEFVVENTKNRVSKKVECSGGPACNAAYLLGKWKEDVTFVGLAGNDFYGQKIVSSLKQMNVNTEYLELRDGYETTTSYILANQANGSRTILTYRGKGEEMKEKNLSFTPDIMLIDGEEYTLSKAWIEKYPTAVTVMDAGRFNEQNDQLAKLVDYVVCSHEFALAASGMTNLDHLEEMYGKLKQRYPGKIIVTLEEKGCLYEEAGVLKIFPALKVKALDTTGAGDIFHGAFVYGLSQKMALEDILFLSTVTSGLSVTRIGGTNSIFPLEIVLEKCRELR